MRKGVISQRYDLGTTALRLVSEAKGTEEVEEKVAKVVLEWGRSILQACTPTWTKKSPTCGNAEMAIVLLLMAGA
jgi:hypothetical protein